MSRSDFTSLPSFRRQNLLAEFSGLKQACPEGVFMTLTPGDPSLWSGFIFVRKGPYAPAVLRFQISFPDAYPSLPPLVTFSTEMFHPLIASNTNHMHSSDAQEGGTASAPDDERLPPGGFSLRHGFPVWFGRAGRSTSSSAANRRIGSGGSGGSSGNSGKDGDGPAQLGPQTPPKPGSIASAHATPTSAAVSPFTTSKGRGSIASDAAPAASASVPPYTQTRPAPTDIWTYDVLDYIRRAFDDESVLDAVPLEAAGDPGAWHAWRFHRREQGKATLPESGGDLAGTDTDAAGSVSSAGAAATDAANASRNPGEWNWEHVWESRAKKCISNSLSDPVLFGSAGAADDVIRFLSMEDGDVEAVKENLKRTLGASM